MKICTTLLLGTLAALAAAVPVAADAPGAACALLTQADLDEATGSPSGPGTPMDQDVPAAEGQHVTMHSCLWPIRAVMGQAALSMGPAPPGQSAKSISLDNVGMEALRKQHYTQDTKDFGNTFCFTMAPPASVKDGINMSSCSTMAQAQLVSVTLMSPSKKFPMEQTKTVLDKALTRLH